MAGKEVVGRQPAPELRGDADVEQTEIQVHRMRRSRQSREHIGARPPCVEAGGCRHETANVTCAGRVAEQNGSHGFDGYGLRGHGRSMADRSDNLRRCEAALPPTLAGASQYGTAW